MARETSLTITTGGQGTGKTHNNVLDCERYIKSGRPVLIYDTNQEYTQDYINKTGAKFQIKLLRMDQVRLFSSSQKPEVRRILPIHPNGSAFTLDEKIKAAEVILTEFRGGLVVLEDFNTYCTGVHQQKGLISNIVAFRQRSQDCILSLQALRAIEPRMWQNTRYVRYHYETGKVDSLPKDRKDSYELLKISELMMLAEVDKGNMRFYTLIDRLQRKIYGKFTTAQFKAAVEQFVLLQKRELKQTELLITGNATNKKQLAFNKLVARYMVHKGN